jgi:hypothetical protein
MNKPLALYHVAAKRADSDSGGAKYGPFDTDAFSTTLQRGL